MNWGDGIMLKNRKGFSLLEVVLGVAILGIIIIPFFSTITNSIKAISFSNDKVKANTIAQRYMEKTKSDDLGMIATFPKSYNYTDGDFKTVVTVNKFSGTDFKKKVEAADSNIYDYTMTLKDKVLVYDGNSYNVGDNALNVEYTSDGTAISFKSHDFSFSVPIAILNSSAKIKIMCSGSNDVDINLENKTDTDANKQLAFTVQGEKGSVSNLNISSGSGDIKVNKLQQSSIEKDPAGNIIEQPDDSVYDINIEVKKSDKNLITVSGTKKVE